MKRQTRFLVWIIFAGSVLLVLGLKSWQLGWLSPNPPLELNGKPAVLVFVKHRGICECEQYVNSNARSQAANWNPEDRGNVPLYLIDIEQRSDLAKRYSLIRSPALLLLDAGGEIVWRQDDVITDQRPFDLIAAESQITQLLVSGGNRNHE